MLDDALSAFRQILSAPFRATLLKTLALTLALLALVWAGLDLLILRHVAVDTPWLRTALTWLTGIGLFVGLAFLIAPTSLLVAGIFLDDIALRVEREIAPEGPTGRPPPAGQGLWLAAKFAGVSALVNLVALALLLVPGVNLAAFFLANSYLMGREYFELAALRHRPIEEVRSLRNRHAPRLFLCGMPIAALMTIPVVNLCTPLFATAFMVRMHRRIAPPPVAADGAPQATRR